MTIIDVKISNFQNYKMADGHHFNTVKWQYLSNGLTDHREIWHDDEDELYAYCFTY